MCSVTVGEAKLAEFSLKAASKQNDEPARSWRYRTQAAVHYDALAAVPSVAERIKDYPLPAGTSLAATGIITQHEQAMSLDKAALEVSGAQRPDLVVLKGLRPFHFTLDDGFKLSNPEGDLATLATRDIDLAWLNPVLKDMSLSGRLASADFKLVAPNAGSLDLGAAAPLSIERFGFKREGHELLRGLAIKVSPDVHYSATDSQARLKNISIRSGAGNLIQGDLDVALHNEANQPAQTSAKGRLALDVARVAAQPLVAAALSEEAPGEDADDLLRQR